jgi:hypothetical protein
MATGSARCLGDPRCARMHGGSLRSVGTADPIARSLRRAAAAVGVVGIVVLTVAVAGEARRPAEPVTAKTLAVSVGDGVGSAFPDQAECTSGTHTRTRWGCLVGDQEGSGGATYDVIVHDRCWTAAIVSDASEGRNMPRRAHGCVPRR